MSCGTWLRTLVLAVAAVLVLTAAPAVASAAVPADKPSAFIELEQQVLRLQLLASDDSGNALDGEPKPPPPTGASRQPVATFVLLPSAPLLNRRILLFSATTGIQFRPAVPGTATEFLLTLEPETGCSTALNPCYAVSSCSVGCLAVSLSNNRGTGR
jgi:hypothetical protein